MSPEAIIAVSAAVVALTQLCKWGRLIEDRRGPFAVMGLAMLGVLLWGLSHEETFDRLRLWEYFAGWIVVSTSAAGTFGFTRALPEAVTSTKQPPAGAGNSPTAPSR